ncbi:hypothetical protein PLESTB_001667800 [Pleodorina starrii]|uniref:Uncharacterized protein n=1 Tax=Pleodorina starrii TaxID=330485 RepID=A0A9W6BY83_9CHLO|nr:hypothetical protein PLESTM_000626900 [Pleodorina starrii]GLC60761.1 hypothetical protein PLESTB_001667800 [Pleodorina starrii]GLC75480.1 hypothetical protein PLESTF_001642200 [Pleodorina starrii]
MPKRAAAAAFLASLMAPKASAGYKSNKRAKTSSMAAMMMSQMPSLKASLPSSVSRANETTGWRRRTLRLVDLCMKLDAEHVLCKAMRRWPVAALLEATEGWTADMFALVARDWRLKKVARLLEAKGRSFTVECCAEWEPEYLQLLLPEVDLTTARHVLAELYFKSDDKHLSPWECRSIVEQFGTKSQRKLLRKFSDRDVARVLRASPGDESSDDDSEEDEDEDNSMDGFIVDGGDDGECVDGEEADEDEDDEQEEEDEQEDDEDEDEDGAAAMQLDLGAREAQCEDSSEDGEEREAVSGECDDSSDDDDAEESSDDDDE